MHRNQGVRVAGPEDNLSSPPPRNTGVDNPNAAQYSPSISPAIGVLAQISATASSAPSGEPS